MRRLLEQMRGFARRLLSTPSNPAVWLQVTKAAVASAAAWELARQIVGSALPVFAPLAAMLAVQATVVESLRTSVQRTIGVVAGVLLAFLLASALGLHWWSVGILVFLGLIIGQSLALGPSGSSQIAVSALLVLVLSGGSNRYAINRALDTLIGAAVGVIVSWIVPALHLNDSGRSIRRFADAIASVVTANAEALRSGWPGTATSTRLEQARGLAAVQTRTRAEVNRGRDSTRYNLRGRASHPAVDVHLAALRRLTHAEIMVRGITRTLTDEAEAAAVEETASPPLPDELRGQLVTVLLGAAETLRQAGRAAVDDDGTVASPAALDDLHTAGRSTAADARALVRAARRAELPARQWLVLGSVLTDLRRLVSELDERAGPLDIPLAARLRHRSRRGFGRRRSRRSPP